MKLSVKSLSSQCTKGLLLCGQLAFPCALGRSGRTAMKHEGDGATPLGTWSMLAAFYRPDRILRPRTGLPLRPIRRHDGWCDDTENRNYNRPVNLPYPASAEKLWREDHLYDLLIVLDHNHCPRVKGLGSAIFMHVAKPGFSPTEGCIALRLTDLIKVINNARYGTQLTIAAY